MPLRHGMFLAMQVRELKATKEIKTNKYEK
jgi:hypothetical protein